MAIAASLAIAWMHSQGLVLQTHAACRNRKPLAHHYPALASKH